MYETTPDMIWWNGQVVPWGEATVHVTSEVATRGVNVFEGTRAYWQQAHERHATVYLDRHLARLRRSARLLRFPAEDADEHISQMRSGLLDLIQALGHKGDLYLRPTVYIDEGRYGWRPGEVRLGSYIAGYPIGTRPPETITCVVSTWRRTPDLAVSPLIKTGAAYQAFRLPRIEAALAGADEAILLNTRDTVAETGGAAVFLVRDGMVVTPPLADGILDGITRAAVIRLLRSRLDVSVVERSIPRTELYTADEVFLCGTLDEVRVIATIDGVRIGAGDWPLAREVRELYLAICSGASEPIDPDMLTTVSPASPAGSL